MSDPAVQLATGSLDQNGLYHDPDTPAQFTRSEFRVGGQTL